MREFSHKKYYEVVLTCDGVICCGNVVVANFNTVPNNPVVYWLLPPLHVGCHGPTSAQDQGHQEAVSSRPLQAYHTGFCQVSQMSWDIPLVAKLVVFFFFGLLASYRSSINTVWWEIFGGLKKLTSIDTEWREIFGRLQKILASIDTVRREIFGGLEILASRLLLYVLMKLNCCRYFENSSSLCQPQPKPHPPRPLHRVPHHRWEPWRRVSARVGNRAGAQLPQQPQCLGLLQCGRLGRAAWVCRLAVRPLLCLGRKPGTGKNVSDIW